MKPILLGVNIDHVATLRQARGTTYPSLVEAARVAEAAGADGITIHLREDRRHIQDADVYALAKTLSTRMNFEMAVTDEMINIAADIKPAHCCLVPEKREELTTEGGLDVVGQFERVKAACKRLGGIGIEVSLFIDPDLKQIKAAKDAGAPAIEIHTGTYAEAESPKSKAKELKLIQDAARYAASLDLIVNAGHGLTLANVQPVAAIPEMNELNIGHSLIADAIFSGLEQAVRQMKQRMVESR